MTKRTLITGFPRIGENRELKKALESYWSNKITLNELNKVSNELKEKHWLLQKNLGIDYISSNDFSLYDNMLDTIVMLNAIPERFRNIKDKTELYFTMARGNKTVTALEMTKWFNANYHYLVPELDSGINFKLNAEKIVNEYNHAKELGINSKINIIGPITFTALCKTSDGSNSFKYFDEILGIYSELLLKIKDFNDSVTIQIDEPIFVKNPPEELLSLIEPAYNILSTISKKLEIVVTTYFEHSVEAVKELSKTSIWGIGLDFVYGKQNFEALRYIKDKKLIAGIVDGRNIWLTNLNEKLNLLKQISETTPVNQIIISTSCSLLHVPFTLENEPESSIKQWLAFATEKVEEVAFLGSVFYKDELSITDKNTLSHNRVILEEKLASNIIKNSSVAERVANIKTTTRSGHFNERIAIQKEVLNLPDLPTTTIGSFPQTPELRKTRRAFRNGKISIDNYNDEIRKYINECITIQEEIGLDVLVHGEPERNDMVEFFGEKLNGFHFTKNGWVQSYGSRCVKPPVIYGDISRSKAMTVDWISYAQSKTSKIMKGMLTGPVTIINWSFVRNDIPKSEIANQIALCLADEINDLQKAGIKIVQVDEAAFKEGYPLRYEKVSEYEQWAVNSFKLSVSSAKKETQIHTHMCYSEFNDIIDTIQDMDADVITIETARSGNRLLNIFNKTGYENEIGPGIYDIHSPRIPSIEESKKQIEDRLKVVNRSKMWVNPDCGLKTRKWEEVKPALKNMVDATLALR